MMAKDLNYLMSTTCNLSISVSLTQVHEPFCCYYLSAQITQPLATPFFIYKNIL